MSDIAFIILYVENVAASEAFYAQALGRRAVDSSPTFAMLPAGPGLMLGLWRRDGVAPKADAPGGSEIAFALANDAAVDAAFAQWRERGARIAQTPMALDFGYTFVALDPDGHRVRIFSPRG